MSSRNFIWLVVLPGFLGGCPSMPRGPRGPGAKPDPRDATTFVTDAVAHVVRVVDADTIVIARGERDGFVPPAEGEWLTVSPRPAPTDARPQPAVRFGIRSAVAKVKAVGTAETELDLERIAAPIAVGDYVSWTARAPIELQNDPVVRCAHLDIGMRTLNKDELVVLPELVAGGRAAASQAVDAMLAEVHAQAELAGKVHKIPADGGRFEGLTLQVAFEQTRRDDVLAFLDFVASFPGKYLTWNWKFVEIYGTWIINRTPSGESLHLATALDPLAAEARTALRAHDWSGAASAWRRMLAIDPEHTKAKAWLAAIDALAPAERRLAHDPGARDAAWQRAEALAQLGFDEDALAAWEALVAAGYRVREAKKNRVWRLAALERWDDAGLALDELIAEKREPGLDGWRDFVRARSRLVALGGQHGDEAARLYLELARVHESAGSWAAATTAYRQALDVAEARELRDVASAGQVRAAERERVRTEEDLVIGKVEAHDLTAARAQADAIVQTYEALQLPGDATRALTRFADAAGDVEEAELQGEWLDALVSRAPADPDAWTRLGNQRILVRRWEEAEAAFERANKVGPLSLWARRSRAWIYTVRGRFADAKAAASLGAKADGDLAMTLARALVVAGDYAGAKEFGEAAAEREPARFGPVPRAIERLAAGAATRGKGPAAALSRVRAFMTIGLVEHASLELAHITDDSVAREAAWEIAQQTFVSYPGTWALDAARREGGSTPERMRVLEELSARAAFEASPTLAARRRYATALAARGRFDAALAVIGGGTNEPPTATRVVEPELRELRARVVGGKQGMAARTRGAEAFARGDPKSAAKHFASARAQFAAAGALGLILEAARDEVWAIDAENRRAEARALAVTTRALAEADGATFVTLDLEGAIARIDQADGDLAALEKVYERHLATCVALEQEHCQALQHHYRADLYFERGRGDEAVAEAERAVALWRGLRDAKNARSAGLELAKIRRARGELRLAMQLTESIFREASAAGDADNERQALLELGTAAYRVGDAVAAKRWLKAAAEAAERYDDRRARAAAGRTLGQVALDLEGDLATARSELDKARGIYAGLGDEVAALDIVPLLARADPAHAVALTTNLVERVRPRGRRLALIAALVARGRALLDAGRATEAEPFTTEALSLVNKIDFPELLARVHQLAGDGARAAADERRATDHYVLAARAVAESLRDAGAGLPLGNDTKRVIDDAVAGLFKDGRNEEALEISTLQQMAGAGSLIALARQQSDSGTAGKELEDLSRAVATRELAYDRLRAQDDLPLTQQNAAARQKLFEITVASDQQINALLVTLQSGNRGFYTPPSVNPSNLANVRAKLPAQAIIVVYVVARDMLKAFVVRKADAETRVIHVDVGRERLTQTIARHRSLLATDGRLALALGRDLYDWLLRPIESLVTDAERTKSTVVVVAEGSLQFVPFGALVASPADAPVVTYAAERWRLATALSETVFKLEKPPPKRPKRRTVLALLDPTNQLDGARQELDGVDGVTRLLGADATTAAFVLEAPRHQVVHIATHGHLDEVPSKNGLMLADAPLTVANIMALETLNGHVRLVVLSACGTATELFGADRLDGQLISSARAFAVAGVPSIVASLWDVDDQATRKLMNAFYAALADPRHDTLDALRAAQNALRADPQTADPRFWAAFQLIGDWR